MVIFLAPWGAFDAEGQQGKHVCPRTTQHRADMVAALPRQAACARCDRLIEITAGQRLDLNGEPHDCAGGVPPALEETHPRGRALAVRGDASTPQTAEKGTLKVAGPSQPSPPPRPPVTPDGEPPARWLLDE